MKYSKLETDFGCNQTPGQGLLPLKIFSFPKRREEVIKKTGLCANNHFKNGKEDFN